MPQCSIRGRNRVSGPWLPFWHRFRDQREPWSGFSHDNFGKFSTFFVKSGVKYDIKIYPSHHLKSRNFGKNLFAPLVLISHNWPNRGSIGPVWAASRKTGDLVNFGEDRRWAKNGQILPSLYLENEGLVARTNALLQTQSCLLEMVGCTLDTFRAITTSKW